jgi:hypothetical protein
MARRKGSQMNMDDKKQIADALCIVIGASLPSAKLTTKWNAPNFAIDDCDLITLNFSPKHPVRVVFHRGAKAVDSKTGSRFVQDDSGRLTWATDQRAYTSFSDLSEVQSGGLWLADFCKKWAQAVKQQLL